MKLLLFTIAIASASTSPSEQTCEKVSLLRSEMNILLLFLTDKEKHEKECPELEWEQPDIEVYKKERRPLLPPECGD